MTMRLGNLLARYSLVVVIAWFGAMKFTSYEAQGIQPLIAHSPFVSWLYDVFSVSTFSAPLGIFELAAAVLLSLKTLVAQRVTVGSVMAIALFLATISFLFTTPDVFETSAGGFPLLSLAGGFLIKDVALLGLAVWTLADTLASTPHRRVAARTGWCAVGTVGTGRNRRSIRRQARGDHVNVVLSARRADKLAARRADKLNYAKVLGVKASPRVIDAVCDGGHAAMLSAQAWTSR